MRGMAGMRMSNTADSRECTIKDEMRGQIGGWSQGSFDDLAINVGDHQIFRFHFFVRNATRLDNNEAFITRNPAGVPEGIKNKPRRTNSRFACEDFLAEGL